jgi:hypothetical protein
LEGHEQELRNTGPDTGGIDAQQPAMIEVDDETTADSLAERKRVADEQPSDRNDGDR